MITSFHGFLKTAYRGGRLFFIFSPHIHEVIGLGNTVLCKGKNDAVYEKGIGERQRIIYRVPQPNFKKFLLSKPLFWKSSIYIYRKIL